jgi:hypothetical protein
MDLQQYKYRRNFPYNNTIQEDSDEMLSENKSSVTFNSMRAKARIDPKYFQNYPQQVKGGPKRKSLFSQQPEEYSPDDFDLKSENFVRNYSNKQDKEHIYIRNLNGEVSNFNKRSSEKYIKSHQIDNFRDKKVLFLILLISGQCPR